MVVPSTVDRSRVRVRSHRRLRQKVSCRKEESLGDQGQDLPEDPEWAETRRYHGSHPPPAQQCSLLEVVKVSGVRRGLSPDVTSVERTSGPPSVKGESSWVHRSCSEISLFGGLLRDGRRGRRRVPPSVPSPYLSTQSRPCLCVGGVGFKFPTGDRLDKDRLLSLSPGRHRSASRIKGLRKPSSLTLADEERLNGVLSITL